MCNAEAALLNAQTIKTSQRGQFFDAMTVAMAAVFETDPGMNVENKTFFDRYKPILSPDISPVMDIKQVPNLMSIQIRGKDGLHSHHGLWTENLNCGGVALYRLTEKGNPSSSKSHSGSPAESPFVWCRKCDAPVMCPQIEKCGTRNVHLPVHVCFGTTGNSEVPLTEQYFSARSETEEGVGLARILPIIAPCVGSDAFIYPLRYYYDDSKGCHAYKELLNSMSKSVDNPGSKAPAFARRINRKAEVGKAAADDEEDVNESVSDSEDDEEPQGNITTAKVDEFRSVKDDPFKDNTNTLEQDVGVVLKKGMMIIKVGNKNINSRGEVAWELPTIGVKSANKKDSENVKNRETVWQALQKALVEADGALVEVGNSFFIYRGCYLVLIENKL